MNLNQTFLRLFFLVALIITICGCKKDNPVNESVISEPSGAVFVTVKIGNQVVHGATVLTNPQSDEYLTGTSGTVMIRGILPGTYQLYAYRENLGSGSTAIEIEEGELTNAIIEIQPGIFDHPIVDFVHPAEVVVPANAVTEINAAVMDYEDNADELSFNWSTDVEGVISEQGMVEGNNLAVLEYTFETIGPRLLTLTVTDSDGNSGSDEIIINVVEAFDPVVLNPVMFGENGIELQWSASSSEDFLKYKIYRQGSSDFDLLAVRTSWSDTTYNDAFLEPNQEYHYRIGVVRSDGVEVLSNTVSFVSEGGYIEIGMGLDRLLANPYNQMIYGLDFTNSSLLFIDTDLNEVVNILSLDPDPVDMSFSVDYERMYIAHGGLNQVTVVDLSQASVETTFPVDTWSGTQSGDINTITALSDNRLAYMCDKTHHRLFMCSASNGELISMSANTYSKSYITRNHDGSGLFIGEYSSSGSRLFRIGVIDDELVQEDMSNSVSYSKQVVNVTANGEYVFYHKRKYLSGNLTFDIGLFDGFIFSINADGSRALGSSKIYDGYTYQDIADLPFETEVSVFSNDGSLAYLFDENTSRLFIIETP